jgi:hypothetical protein
MTAAGWTLAGCAALVGCAAPLERDRDHSAVVEEIGQTFTIAAPLPATIYVDYRAVSYAGRVVEYGVLVDDRPLVVTYGVEPTAPLPLATRVFDGVDGAPLVALLADDRVLDVHIGDDALPIRVPDYLTTLATPGPAVALGAIPTELRPLLDAVLPARAEIAPVPAFWRNLDQPPPPGGDLGASSSAGRALLPNWSAPLSLLGALFVQGPCVRDDRYRCPCMTVELTTVGRFSTCAADALDDRKPGWRSAPAPRDSDAPNRSEVGAAIAAAPLQ